MSLSPATLAKVRFSGRPAAQSRRDFRPTRLLSRPRPRAEASLSVAERSFVDTVFESGGLAAAQYRDRPLQRRIAAVLRKARVADVGQHLQAVRADELLAAKALDELLIGYTTPFRDPPVFQRLADGVLPLLAAKAAGIRVWSAACSSGAELYSVGLLLAAGRLQHGRLLGTDSRASAIRQAPHNAEAFWESVPGEFRHLKAKVSRGHFLAHVQQIDWQTENVFASQHQACFDLVLCRNLAIYLEPAAVLLLWRLMHQALAPGGVLVTGKAEKPLPASQWRRIDTCLYRVEKS